MTAAFDKQHRIVDVSNPRARHIDGSDGRYDIYNGRCGVLTSFFEVASGRLCDVMRSAVVVVPRIWRCRVSSSVSALVSDRVAVGKCAHNSASACVSEWDDQSPLNLPATA